MPEHEAGIPRESRKGEAQGSGQLESQLPAPKSAESRHALGTEADGAIINHKTLHWLQGGVVLIAETVSLGILSLPSVVATLGLVPGIVLILFTSVLSTFSGLMLADFHRKHPHVQNFGDALEIVGKPLGLGKVFQEFFGWAQVLLCIFVMAGHLLSWTICMNTLTNSSTCTIIWAVVGLGVFWILNMPRTLRYTSWMSLVSCLSVTLATLITVGNVATSPPAHGGLVEAARSIKFVQGMLAVSNITVAFSGHSCFFNVLSELKNPRDFPKALAFLQITATSLFLVAAVVTYVYVGPSVPSPALSASSSPVWRKVIWGIAIPTIVIAGVIYAHVAARYIFVRVFRNTKHLERRTTLSTVSWVAITFGIWMLAMIIAESVPVFNSLLGLIAALFAPPSWSVFILFGTPTTLRPLLPEPRSKAMMYFLDRPRVKLVLSVASILIVFSVLYFTLFGRDPAYYPSHVVDSHGSTTPSVIYHDDERRLGRMSHLHYLVPSNGIRATLCAGLTSALANGYPIPRILGYKGKGEFDAAKAHIAKLHAIKRYFDGIPRTPDADNDLVMVVDGFDVLPQLPASTVVERYFEMTGEADAKLANQRGIRVDELHAMGLRQTLLWGTDKGCFPGGGADPRCWMVPYSGLPPYVWGPRTKPQGELPYSDPRFLNSGTVIGPLGDLRTFIEKTLSYINETFDDEFRFRNSDQYYISTLYARQEYQRLLDLNSGKFPLEVNGRYLPTAKQSAEDRTEYHVFVDHASAFAQTRCHNDAFMRDIRFERHDLTAVVRSDPFHAGDKFTPFAIQMPSAVYQGLHGLFESLPAADRPTATAGEWIRGLRLGTNVATHKLYPLYHHTCRKEGYVEKHQRSWYYPLIQPLLRAARTRIDDGAPLHPSLVDGRVWTAPQRYPRDAEDEFGGVFTDRPEEPFIPLQEVCREHLPAVMGLEVNTEPTAETETTAT
ncbi:hypothetical protein S40288_07941 [Stachybotrys chartarum IBT 40288]|nr:hypothetical protein S40288_07941 [Stachybotrys chartarum IBT 40288]